MPYTAAQQAAIDAAGARAAQYTPAQQAAIAAANARASQPYKPTSWIDALGHGISQAPQDLATATGQLITGLPTAIAGAVTHPAETDAALRNTLSQGASQAGAYTRQLIGGAVQRVRDLSPASEQGSAPAMDTTTFDQAQQQFGTEQGLQGIVANHPVATALAAAAILHPTLNATGAYRAAGNVALAGAKGLGDLVNDAAPGIAKAVTPVSNAIGGVASRVGDVATSGDTLKTSLGTMQGGDVVPGVITDAQSRAQAVSDQAAQAREQSNTLAQQSASVHPGDTAPVFQFGDTGPASLSDMGNTVRDPAFANQSAIELQMRAADDKYRSAMNAVADDKANAGIGVSDTPEAQALIANSKSIVQPNPLTRPGVGNVPADSAGGKLHKMLLDVFDPPGQKLTLEEADTLASQGIPVTEGADGKFTRPIKPSLQNVDDFRRLLGKIAGGNVSGYEGINTLEAAEMRKGVSAAMDTYANGTSEPVQANWAAGKQALAPYENVNTGKAIVGMQDNTGVPNVPASQIPGRMLAGGRDTMAATAAVAGQGPVTSVLASQLHNAFLGAKSADAASALVAPGTQLGDAVAAHDPLQVAVSDYLNRFKMHEAATAQASDLSQQSQAYGKMADTLSGNADKATAVATKYQQQLDDLQSMSPKDVGPQYVRILRQARADGIIGQAQVDQGLQIAQTAKQAMSDRTLRNRWLLGAAGIIGVKTHLLGHTVGALAEGL